MKDRNELTWRTSSRSGGGQCVEIAIDGEHVYMRHSKDPAGPILTFDREAFRDFIAYLKTGALDA
jgi:Domain of unknown function (DUF397)